MLLGRNTTLTVSGYTYVELTTGRRPAKHADLELTKPDQLSGQDLLRASDLRQDLARVFVWIDDDYLDQACPSTMSVGS